ncbi:MAG TPA: hypothetical protein VKR06_18045, partial [Ktedonosporobacter sp.]|nr:hypothetical protein [Ktedonosporobacter sp.]
SWVLMSCQQFIKESRHTLGETVIYRALHALIKRGYIKRRRNPADLYGSRQYRLNLAEIQQALDAHVHNLQSARNDLEEEKVDVLPITLENDTSSAPQANDGTSEERGNDTEGVHESTGGTRRYTDGVCESTEGTCISTEEGPYKYGHTKTPKTLSKNTIDITKTGGFAADGDDALRIERVTRTITELAAILRLPVTPELQRLVEEYSTIPDLFLLGEADDARAWIADPTRNRGQKTLTLHFFRDWIKRQVETLRRQEAEREQAKEHRAASTSAKAAPGSEAAVMYPPIAQLGPDYQEFTALMKRRAQAQKNNNK